jgi:hypothetical protein
MYANPKVAILLIPLLWRVPNGPGGPQIENEYENEYENKYENKYAHGIRRY